MRSLLCQFYGLLILFLPFQIWGQSFQLDSLTSLSAEINESSGLIELEGRLLTHNDSGGEAALYEVDSLTGMTVRTVILKNGGNQDWEDIARDSTYLYIGDFGNNNGSRQNLRIYRLPIDAYLSTTSDTVEVDTISFSYADQIDFTSSQFSTNYDAEALIAYGDSLYIFTKNWGNFASNIYALPKIPGQYSLSKMDSLAPQGLITGADYDPLKQEIVLTGYTITHAFVMRISQWAGNVFSSGNIEQFPLQLSGSFQLESIAQLADGTYRLSTESNGQNAGVLYRLSFEESMSQATEILSGLHIYPNPATDYIHIESLLPFQLCLLSLSGQELLRSKESWIDISQIPDGGYFLRVSFPGHPQQFIHKLLIE
ncbi:MAG: hypothetical protein AAF587_07385 [Bacteroidota bacterium]